METFDLYNVERVVGETSFLWGLDYFECGRVRTAKFVPPDPGHGEAAGIFEQSGIVGAFGARRQ